MPPLYPLNFWCEMEKMKRCERQKLLAPALRFQADRFLPKPVLSALSPFKAPSRWVQARSGQVSGHGKMYKRYTFGGFPFLLLETRRDGNKSLKAVWRLGHEVLKNKEGERRGRRWHFASANLATAGH